MKELILTFSMVISVCFGFSQNTEEWMNQGKTQTKYLLRQIAAVKTYIGLIQKGYNTVRDGLNIIADIKSGDFTIHSGYFSSLKKVNPAIAGYVKIADIIIFQKRIILQY